CEREVAHLCLRFSRLGFGIATSIECRGGRILVPGGRHGTGTRIEVRAGPFVGGDHPSEHDVGGSPESYEQYGCRDPVERRDLSASTFSFVLRAPGASLGLLRPCPLCPQ